MAAMNDGDMAWTLTSAALVQIMTPGLAFFYGGMVSESAVVNTMMLSYGSMAVVTVLWSLIGYSMAFGPNTPTSIIGTDALATYKFGPPAWDGPLRQIGIDATGAPIVSTISEHTYAMFQLMFAIITSALISGSVATKIKYTWWIAFTALWHLLVYTTLAHWVFYYDGWMFKYGVIDFAGGLVVHISSGVSGFTLAAWLGGPKHRHSTNPHNVPYVLLGAALLWFGWFGFNAGSALAANGQAGRVFLNTQLSAAMAMMTWGALEFTFLGDTWFSGRPTAVGAASGAVVGLVGITPACAFVSSMWSLFIGFFTTLVVYFSPRLMRMTGVDDKLDCFAFHGVGGLVGALLTGLFADVDANGLGDASLFSGGFFGNGLLFAKQIAGCLVAIVFSAIMTSLIYGFLRFCAWVLKDDLCIPEELQHGEVDASQHGEKAYFRKMSPAVVSESGAPAAAAPAVAAMPDKLELRSVARKETEAV